MGDRVLYQTVEDNDNPDYIESHGPFKCTRTDAWLGHGYYFWDSLIEVAHWWGRKSYSSNYVICQSTCDDSLDKVYDTVGHPELIKDIYDVSEVLRKDRNVPEVFIPEVLEYMKCHTDFLERYKAIRMYTLDTKNRNEGATLRFTPRYKAYIDTFPPIQFCFFDNSLFTSDYTIVYPEDYVMDGVM